MAALVSMVMKHHKKTFAKQVEVADLPPPGEVESLWWWVLTPDAADVRFMEGWSWLIDAKKEIFVQFKTHDGSMVLLYMVCHGSHQYTPFMLAYHTMDASW